MATSQSPGLPEALTIVYNPGMCLLALPVIEEKDLRCKTKYAIYNADRVK